MASKTLNYSLLKEMTTKTKMSRKQLNKLNKLNIDILRDSKNAKLYNERGMIYLQNMYLDEAANDLKTAIELDNSAQVYLHNHYNISAFILVRDDFKGEEFLLSKTEEILSDISKLISNDPNNDKIKKDSGQIVNAIIIQVLDEYLTNHPNCDEILVKKAFLYYQISDNKKALADLNNAEKINNRNQKIYELRWQLLTEEGRNQEAIDDITKVIKVETMEINLLVNRADLYSKLKKYEEAIRDLNSAIDLNPKNAILYFLRGDNYLEVKNSQLALNDYSKVIELEPDNLNARKSRVEILTDIKQYEKAIHDLKIIVRTTPETAFYFSRMGYCYSALDDYKNATKYLSKTVEIEPANAQYRYYLADVYASQSKYVQALKQLNTAIELEQNEKEYYLLRGNINAALKKFKKAIRDYSTAKKLGSKSDRLFAGYYHCYKELGDIPLAIKNLSHLIEILPDKSIGYFNRAELYAEQKQFKKAITDMDRVLKLEPEHAYSYFLKSEYQSSLKEYNDSLESKSMAIKLEPDNIKYYYSRCHLYCDEFKQFDKAEEDIDKCIELSNNVELLVNRADLYVLQKKYKAALIDLTKALETDSNNSDYLYRRFRVYKELQNYDSCLDDLNKLILLDQNNYLYFHERSKIFLFLKEYQKALADLNDAIALNDKDAQLFLERYSLIIFTSNDFDRAIADLNKCMKINSYYKRFALIHRGEFYLEENKNYEKALKDLLEAESLIDTWSSSSKKFIVRKVFSSIAECYLLLNDKQNAIRYIQKVSSVSNSSMNSNLDLDTDQAKEIDRPPEMKIQRWQTLIMPECDLIFFVEAICILLFVDKNKRVVKQLANEAHSRQIFLEKKLLNENDFMKKNTRSFEHFVSKEFSYLNDKNIFRNYKNYKKWYFEFEKKGYNFFLLKWKSKLLKSINSIVVKGIWKEKSEFKIVDIDEILHLNRAIQHRIEEALEEEIEKYYKLANDIRLEEQKNANQKISNIVQQYTHSLSNTLFPNTIYEVAQKLKKHTKYKKDAMILTDAYHAEIFMKHQGQLLAIRNTATAKSFQSYIRGDRLINQTKEDFLTIIEIINNSSERVLSRFFNDDYHKLDKIRKVICEKFKIELMEWKDKFEREVFYEENNTIDWINNNFASIKLSVSDLWSDVRLKKSKYAESLLQGYFSELFFNALKYRDQQKENWVEIEFTEEDIDGELYLAAIWKNEYQKGENISISTKKGLLGIKNDLEMLNDTTDENKTLIISQGKKQFIVKLLFKRDLFLLPPKKKINMKSLFNKEEKK